MYTTLLVDEKEDVLTVSLNRPQVRNSFNDEVISDLTRLFRDVSKKPSLRAIVLKGQGEAFCAGADMEWMKKAGSMNMDDNREDALKLARLLDSISHAPVPVIGLIHSFCFGGGLGLAAVCDYVIASQDARFSFSEVKLGLIPAVIGPFVMRKIGPSWSRALFISAERFDAQKAQLIGLIHRVVDNRDSLETEGSKLVSELLSSSPHALMTVKKYLADLTHLSAEDQINRAAQTLATLRATDEAREGLSAFLEKRKPNWIKK